jgi:hypothetical protein
LALGSVSSAPPAAGVTTKRWDMLAFQPRDGYGMQSGPVRPLCPRGAGRGAGGARAWEGRGQGIGRAGRWGCAGEGQGGSWGR